MAGLDNETQAPEFSLLLVVDDVPPNGKTIRFAVGEAERAALALRFDLLDLSDFHGLLTARPWRRFGLELEGSLEADLVQACVTTLEPISAHLSQKFKLHYLPIEMIEKDAAEAENREIVVDLQSEDPPEPIENGVLDVGEAMSEQLFLEIDPYPKKPGAVFESTESAPSEAEESRPNPFAALEKLKKKD